MARRTVTSTPADSAAEEFPSSSDQGDAAITSPKAARSTRRGIQSIEIGFGILEALCKASGPIPLRTIAEQCSMPVANVHNYLVSFQTVGVVVQEPDTGFYGLGRYALRLGVAAMRQFDINKVARPYMAELGAVTGYSVFLGVWGNYGPTVIYRVEGARNASIVELRLGGVQPLLSSALGRNFLSHLPEQVTEAMVKRELATLRRSGHSPDLPDVPRTMEDVKKLRIETMEQGFSRCKSFLPGFTTLSAPIFNQFGAMVAALTIMGSADELDDSPSSDAVRLLKNASAEISGAAGYTA